jgi:hypothetical protein
MAVGAETGRPAPGVGGVLARAGALVAARPLAVLGLTLLFGALPRVVLTQLTLGLARYGGSPFLWLSALQLLTALAVLASTVVVQGALALLATREEAGEPTGFAAVAGALVARLPGLVAVAVLNALGVLIGLVLAIVPGAILWTQWAVAGPALAAERTGVAAAFGRSQALTRGARWTVFGTLLLVLVSGWLLGLFGGIAAGVLVSRQTLPVVLMVAVSTVLGVVTTVANAAVAAALYLELRDWREGPPPSRLAAVFA